MRVLAGVCGAVLIVVVLWEGFETIILPRRVTRRFRLTRLFYRHTWLPWAKIVTSVIPPERQETWLSIFGPISILLLLALWAGMMVLGYALLQWSAGSAVVMQDGKTGFLIDLYMSGTTFFTLGLGDVVPRNAVGRLLAVIESGMGFAFLALMLAYLPALNQFFSRRETNVSLLDARAGSPPTASEMFRRHGRAQDMEILRQLFHDWEHWSAEFLEGHLSYPVLAYFRSQHDNQSWLAALTAILDACALAMTVVEGPCRHQAQLTFAMARHAVVDLSIIFRTRPDKEMPDRLPPEQLAVLRATLAEADIQLKEEQGVQRLNELRGMYEPYVHVLAAYFRFQVPPWIARENGVDDWQASTWEPRTIGRNRAEKTGGEHF